MGELEFDQDMLTVLMAIDEEKTLLQVAKETKMDIADFKACMLKLYNLGLVEKVEQSVVFLEKRILDEISEILIGLLGPLGVFLMQDAAENINAELPHIPENNLSDFIESILSEIPGDKQKQEFRKIMNEIRRSRRY